MFENKLKLEDVEGSLRDCLKKIKFLKIDLENSFSLNNVMNQYRYFLFSNNPIIIRDQLRDIEKHVDSQLGSDIRVLYHQTFVYELYLENVKKIMHQNLPQEVLTYFKEDFLKIIKFAYKGKTKFLTFNDFQFFSYLQKLCFQCFPVGNQNININGFSRNLIFQQPFIKAVSFVKSILSMKGNFPLFELHYNPHRFRLFNEEGWNNVFFLTAQMMVKYPEIKGVFGDTWFFDPLIKKISPELYYIQGLIQKIGGKFFIVGSSESDRKNAFALSKARRSAYEEGRYQPTSYLMIISRQSLLNFYGL